MATQEQLDQARQEGAEAFSFHGVSHLSSGSHRCPYKNHDTEADLIKAWLEGFEWARLKSL